MIERHIGEIVLRAEALESGFVRIRSYGYDGPKESLLERYGLVEPLETVEAEGAEGDESAALRIGDVEVKITDHGSFSLSRGGEAICTAGPETKVATAPTLGTNRGYQVDIGIVEGERFVGFGDHQREQLALNGRRDTLWIEYPVKHVPVPFYMSSRGYGIFFNTTRKLHYDFGASDPGIARFTVERDYLDIFICTGSSFSKLIERYCRLTGFPGMPPLKSFGLWMIMHTRATGHDVLFVAKTLRDERIPCDNLSLEPDWMEQRYDFSTEKEWNAERFRGTEHGSWFRAGPDRMIQTLGRMGFSLGLWLCCGYDMSREEERRRVQRHVQRRAQRRVQGGSESRVGPPATAGPTDIAESPRAEPDPLDEGRAGPALEGLVVPGESSSGGHSPVYLDRYTKRDEPWFEHLKKFVDDGVRFFKVDPAVLINEFPDRLYANGRHDDEMHNIAFLLSSKQMCEDYEAHTGKRSFGIAVAGWAGLQRYPGTWAGDTGGGAGPMVGILQDGVVGHAYATCDMSTTDETGLHMGFLLPWALLTSWASFHYPGFQGEAMDSAYRRYGELRMSLLLYLYGLARRAHRTGQAIVRPLFMEWPAVDVAYELTRHYLLGNAFLVTVYREGVVLPKGRWYDYISNEIVEGSWDELPRPIAEGWGGHLLLREASIVPTVEPMLHVGERRIEEISWRVFPGAEPASFTLYLDEGDGLDYRSGAYAEATITCRPTGSGHRIEWGEIEGGEPERITGLGHRFEFIGIESAGEIGPVRWGEPVEIE